MRSQEPACCKLWILLACLSLAGCHAEAPKAPPPKILLIGLDGADLRVVEQLSAAGGLPNLSKLMKNGVRAPLLTVANSSPIVWTSIATGLLPEKHGIESFTQNGKPVASSMRKRPAFWNILSSYGRSVGVLAWWATFPAESVNGYIISPYMIFQAPNAPDGPVVSLWNQPDPRKTFPPELYAAVEQTMKRGQDMAPENMADVFVGPEQTPQTAWVVARDQSYLELTKALLQAKPVELVATYLQGIDVASHDMSRYVFGGTWYFKKVPTVSVEEHEAAMGRVYAMYERTDKMVGELLDAVTADTDVIVVSDHGWEYDGTGHLHRNPGIFLAAGPSFRKDVAVAPVSVLDIVPLLLSILEVPISRELDGSFPEHVFAADFDREPRWTDRYSMRPVSIPAGQESSAPEDKLMLERLRGLGYIE